MDELAVALGMDPIELRLRNYAESDQSKGRDWSTAVATSGQLSAVSNGGLELGAACSAYIPVSPPTSQREARGLLP